MKNKLRILRTRHDWSQAELARRLGVSRQTVNAVEREKYDPSLPLAFKIAELFETAIEDVFENDGAPAAGGRTDGGELAAGAATS